MNQLNRFDKFTFYYFIGFSPVTVGFMIWATLTDFANQHFTGFIWDFFGWAFIAWIIALFYIVTKMLFSKKVRNIIMAKLAGVKERDERESVVAGNAAKFSFLSTFALLLFMFVFSITTLSVKKDPTLDPSKHGNVSIGFNFTPTDKDAFVHNKGDGGIEAFDYKSLPLSKPFLILILMFWQIGSYHLIARKELRE